MKPTQKIIELIEKGDPLPILAEESLAENFNELLKYQLIDIIDDRVVLTQRGLAAKDLSFDKVLADLKTQEELKEFSLGTQKKESKITHLCLGLCLTLLVFFVAVALSDCEILF
ncbi:hypothetical protein [Salinimicrobium terrae]|uniref:hypothetical protein n=1 Tax=Salinimicrobium terrae TaxID=470866 RepID=UPI0003FC2049|nr:hypothetical protein [Salinimicrobium terrae]